MADEISVLVIDSDPSVAEAWASRMKQLGFAQCSSAHSDLPMDELAALKPDLEILGPSLDEDTCVRCIHKLKIVTPFMPVLTSCGGVPLAKGPDIMPFEGIYYVGRIRRARDSARRFRVL